MNAARCGRKDPVREAAHLVGDKLWESTRARLFEGPMVSVLMSSRLDGPGTSDISVTLVTTAELDAGGPVVVTLVGAASYRARLDARGCCVIRGVPDGPYRIDISREHDLVSGAAILRLPGTAG